MAGQGIVHTTQAGEGDAVIFGRESKLSPIDNILNLGAQKQKAKAQSALLKQKLSNDNEQNFLKQIQDISGKSWDRVHPEILQQIGDIVQRSKDVMAQGRDPYSGEDGLEMSGLLGKLGATAGASLKAQNDFQMYAKAIDADRKSSDPQLDPEKSLQALNDYYKGNVSDWDLKAPYQPIYRTPDTEKILGKQYDGNIKALVATYGNDRQDKTLSEDATKIIRESLRKMELEAYTKLQPWVDRGMITPEDAATKIRSYFSKYDDLATLYDKTVDENQLFAKTKEANLQAYRNASLGLRRQALELAKKSKETTPTYAFDEIGRTITSGGSSAVFENTPYEDTDLGIPDGAGGYIYPIISKIEKSEVNPDKSITAVVTLKKPQLSKDGKSVEFVDHILKVPAFDKIGNPVYQNSKLYADIQKNAVKNNISYANISQQEVGSGKANITPTTANNQGGFFNPIKLPAPAKKEIQKSDIPAKAKAAGYSVKEYTKLLQDKGITIK